MRAAVEKETTAMDGRPCSLSLYILEGSSHFGHVEEPDGFARAVREFIDASARAADGR